MKTSSPSIDYFEHIPLPALQEVLLQLDKKQLHYVCTNSRQASKVCSKTHFKKLYARKYQIDPLVRGVFTNISGGMEYDYDYNDEFPDEEKVLEFRDDAGGELTIVRMSGKINHADYRMKFGKEQGIPRYPHEDTRLRADFWFDNGNTANEEGDWATEPTYVLNIYYNAPDEKAALDHFLSTILFQNLAKEFTYIDEPRDVVWENLVSFNVSKKAVRKIWGILKKHVEKVYPAIKPMEFEL